MRKVVIAVVLPVLLIMLTSCGAKSIDEGIAEETSSVTIQAGSAEEESAAEMTDAQSSVEASLSEKEPTPELLDESNSVIVYIGGFALRIPQVFGKQSDGGSENSITFYPTTMGTKAMLMLMSSPYEHNQSADIFWQEEDAFRNELLNGMQVKTLLNEEYIQRDGFKVKLIELTNTASIGETRTWIAYTYNEITNEVLSLMYSETEDVAESYYDYNRLIIDTMAYEIPKETELRDKANEAFRTIDYENVDFIKYDNLNFSPGAVTVDMVFADKEKNRNLICQAILFMDVFGGETSWEINRIFDETSNNTYYANESVEQIADICDIRTDEIIHESEMSFEQFNESIAESVEAIE